MTLSDFERWQRLGEISDRMRIGFAPFGGRSLAINRLNKRPVTVIAVGGALAARGPRYRTPAPEMHSLFDATGRGRQNH